MKTTDSKFKFPEPIGCKSIRHFLENGPSQGTKNEGKLAKSNIKKAEGDLCQDGTDPRKRHFIVDCDAAANRVHWVEGISPCLTRARSAGHWITSKQRRLSKEEMFRLQGMDPTKFHVAVTETQLGQQIGNAMVVNVIERVLTKALVAAGLAKKSSIPDRWESAEAITYLLKTVGKTFSKPKI